MDIALHDHLVLFALGALTMSALVPFIDRAVLARVRFEREEKLFQDALACLDSMGISGKAFKTKGKIDREALYAFLEGWFEQSSMLDDFERTRRSRGM